jgi:chemotaxis protein CheC
MLLELERDTLKEISSMGASHAANSLSAMIGERVEIVVPGLDIIDAEEIPNYLGGHENLMVGIFVKLAGELDATLMILIPHHASLELADIVMGRDTGSTESLSEMDVSAIQEVGGIMSSSFANAISDFLGFKIIPTPPAFACDIAGAMLDFLTVEIGQKVDKTIFFHTTFRSSSREISGHIFLAPEEEALKKVLDAIKDRYGI